MIIADSIVAFGVVALIFLFHFGVIRIWQIYLLMLLRAIGGAFQWPAMQASIPLIVPEKQLTRVSGLNQSLQGMASIVAPPLGALLIEFLPIQHVLVIDVVTAAMAVFPLFFITIPQPLRETKQAQNIIVDLREAVNFALLWKGGLIVIIGAMLGNLLSTPAFSLIPLLVKDYFNRGAIDLAVIQSAWGLGMVIGGGALGVWGGFKRKVVTAMSATILMGAAFLAVGVLPSGMFIYAVAAVFVAGIMNPIINGSLFAAVQATVPLEMQGRYFTLLLSGSAAMTPIGLAIAGPFADFLGIRIWFQLGGLIFIMLGIVSFFVPVIMNMEEFKYHEIEVYTK
jgi:DHA3 family macrolide efflux protein-like MFS transporter